MLNAGGIEGLSGSRSGKSRGRVGRAWAGELLVGDCATPIGTVHQRSGTVANCIAAIIGAARIRPSRIRYSSTIEIIVADTRTFGRNATGFRVSE